MLPRRVCILNSLTYASALQLIHVRTLLRHVTSHFKRNLTSLGGCSQSFLSWVCLREVYGTSSYATQGCSLSARHSCHRGSMRMAQSMYLAANEATVITLFISSVHPVISCNCKTGKVNTRLLSSLCAVRICKTKEQACQTLQI